MELHEATFYGLLEQIPALLTSVNVDAAGSVSTKSTVELSSLSPSSNGNPDIHAITVILIAKKRSRLVVS